MMAVIGAVLGLVVTFATITVLRHSSPTLQIRVAPMWVLSRSGMVDRSVRARSIVSELSSRGRRTYRGAFVRVRTHQENLTYSTQVARLLKDRSRSCISKMIARESKKLIEIGYAIQSAWTIVCSVGHSRA